MHFYQNQYYDYYDYYHHYYYHHYYYHRRPFDYTTTSPFKVYRSGCEFCMYLLVSIRVRFSSTMIYKAHEISKHKCIHTQLLVATVTDIAYATL